jgi:hypothetical protein
MAHVCKQPMRELLLKTPAMPFTDPDGPGVEYRRMVINGKVGDVWRCGCGQLWRVARACYNCDFLGSISGRCARGGGYHSRGLCWPRARMWQRLREWRRAVGAGHGR